MKSQKIESYDDVLNGTWKQKVFHENNFTSIFNKIIAVNIIGLLTAIIVEARLLFAVSTILTFISILMVMNKTEIETIVRNKQLSKIFSQHGWYLIMGAPHPKGRTDVYDRFDIKIIPTGNNQSTITIVKWKYDEKKKTWDISNKKIRTKLVSNDDLAEEHSRTLKEINELNLIEKAHHNEKIELEIKNLEYKKHNMNIIEANRKWEAEKLKGNTNTLQLKWWLTKN